MNDKELDLLLTNAQIDLLNQIGFEHGKIIAEYSDSITNLVRLFYDPRTVEPVEYGHREAKRGA